MTTSSSPTLEAFYAHHPVRILCDTGAEASLIKRSVAVRLGLDIRPTTHSASQADGKTPLSACGEVHLTFTRADLTLPMDAIVLGTSAVTLSEVPPSWKATRSYSI